MTRNELKAIAKRYGMEIIREHITNQGCGVYVHSEELIPELDAYADNVQANSMVSAERAYDGSGYLYRMYCPKAWFDLWGWADD